MAGKAGGRKNSRTSGKAAKSAGPKRSRRRRGNAPAAQVEEAVPAKMLEEMPADSPGARLERDLVAAAIAKQREGKCPNQQEAGALRRFERARRERLRWEIYRSIPQKDWRAMSGRQAKIINQQAELYGIPFGGSTIDLPAVVKALHDFFASNAHKLAAVKFDDPLMAFGEGPALERYRVARAELAELELGKRRGNLLPRKQIRELLNSLAPILRGCGDQLQRRCGREALEILDEHLTVWEREIVRRMGNGKVEGRPEGGGGRLEAGGGRLQETSKRRNG